MHKQPQCQHYHEPYRTHSILMDKLEGEGILSGGSEDKVLKIGMWDQFS